MSLRDKIKKEMLSELTDQEMEILVDLMDYTRNYKHKLKVEFIKMNDFELLSYLENRILKYRKEKDHELL